jgi:hypothetical protein
MISLSRNRILIKLFYDLNPRMAPNVLPAVCLCFAGRLAQPRPGIEIENNLGVDGPECETGSRVPDAECLIGYTQPTPADVLSHR